MFFKQKTNKKNGEAITLNRSTRYVKDIRGQLIALYKIAVSQGIVRSNLPEMVKLNENYKVAYSGEKDDSELFFNEEEIVYFLEIIKDHPLYWFFYFVILFGLRREEALGLRWRAINWKKKTITISHTVAKAQSIVRVDATKRDASRRIYPLTDDQLSILRKLKSEEEKNRVLFGKNYYDSDYIFKHQDGTLYYPDTVTKAFRSIKEAHPELPQGVTLHGLRKSCVSLLVHLGYSIKEIQDWVGQRDEGTTLKIYSKIKSVDSKSSIAERLSGIIKPTQDK